MVDMQLMLWLITDLHPQPHAGQKRTREPATSPRPSKRIRKSAGAEALSEVSSSLTEFGSKIAAALAPPPTLLQPSPIRRCKSITTAIKLEKAWLSTHELAAFIDILRADPHAFDVYLALDEDEIRREWVHIQLKNAGELDLAA